MPDQVSLTVSLAVDPLEIPPGAVVALKATGLPAPGSDQRYVAVWTASPSSGQFQLIDPAGGFQTVVANQETVVTFGTDVQWTPDTGATGAVVFTVQVFGPRTESDFKGLNGNPPTPPDGSYGTPQDQKTAFILAAPPQPNVPLPVRMTRADEPVSDDQSLWVVIRDRTNALSFDRYARFIDDILCLQRDGSGQRTEKFAALAPLRSLPFPDVDLYRVLKVATELFMRMNCGVMTDTPGTSLEWNDLDLTKEGIRLSRQGVTADMIRSQWVSYVDGKDADVATIPYLHLVQHNLDGVAIDGGVELPMVRACNAILRDKLTHPCFVELIWSYWHEEGMLVQSMKSIAWRFQNRRGPAERDPLALLEIDPLRPLNSFIWGYVEDEQHRISVARRAYEYDHEYGITLLGRAVPRVRGADSRSRFLEAFHNLLYLCAIFFKEDDDTTVIADGFPLLNALKEVHLLLTQGAHNQYGDLPWMARQEMLMEQWLLARPEFREYLPRRVMVGYPEPWMHSVETMKGLQGWTDTSILHFHYLAIYGERIMLGARFKDWTREEQPSSAANWARYWRAEIQGYVYAYRAVTGVDLTESTDATMPGVLLRQRLPGRAAQAAALEPGRPAALPRPAVRRSLPARVAPELAEWNETS